MLALAESGTGALAADRPLRNGLNVHEGKVPVAEALQYPFVERHARWRREV